MRKCKPRARKGQTLFIDARQMGQMVDRTHRELTDAEIRRIADTYHAWRKGDDSYSDQVGFCKSATLEEIKKHGFVLTPGRYVGVAVEDEDDEPFDQKMQRLAAEWRALQAEARRLDGEIGANLQELGYVRD